LRNSILLTPTLKLFAVLILSGLNPVAAQEVIFSDSYEQAAEITSFSASLDAIEQGQSTTISWTTVGALLCAPSGGAGDWESTIIDLPNGSAQIEIPDSGQFIFTLTCIGVIGEHSFANEVVDVSPVPAVITSFNAFPDAIAEGDITTLSWTTDFATSCTASNGTGGWDLVSIALPDGDAQVTIPTVGDFTFTLTCNGAVGIPAVAEDMVSVSPAAAITNFSASSDSIAEGETTTLSWTTSNGTGGWDAELIALPAGNAQITIPTAGEYTFTLTCDGIAGTPAVANEVVTVSPAAVITSFTADPSSLVVNNISTISWTIENATSCTPSGGTGGWDAVTITLPDGQADITIDSAGEHTFTLTCDGVAGPAAVDNVVVAATLNPNECMAPPLANGALGFWENFWLVPFPGPASDSRFLTIPRTSYFAMEFNTGNVVDDGKMTTIETTVTDGVRLGAFSKCPGDFDVAPECQHSWGISGGIRWATNGRVGACQLEPNTTYYFNVTFTNGITTSSTCGKSPCITNMQHSNR